MRIYKMTATFGKLQNETLTLEPGLNIITAPNEWGKSTWCAFLLAMFYGLDTRAKSTKTTLADKERYAPWSGQPMEGRVDLRWKDQDITIERRTRQRIPLGEFKAYETASGLPVPELTAANCGVTLLGVEQSVFRRAGFIRLSDLPVTQDEALRRRLNALVTTGDDSGSGDKLSDQLRDLRNKCRYNKSGLLPQAERERDEIAAKLQELEGLDDQCKTLRQRLDSLKNWLGEIHNHQRFLSYAAAEADAARMAQARDLRDKAEAALHGWEIRCAAVPSREEAETRLKELNFFRSEWEALATEQRMLPPEPREPELPPPFVGMTTDAARAMAKRDAAVYTAAGHAAAALALLIFGILGLLGAAVMLALKIYLPGILSAAAALAVIGWGIYEKQERKKQARGLLAKYRDPDPSHWAEPIEEYEDQKQRFAEAQREYREAAGDVEVQSMVMQKRRGALLGKRDLDQAVAECQKALSLWDSLEGARRELETAQRHFETVSAMVKPVAPPPLPDRMTASEAETAQLLSECLAEQQRLQNRLGQVQGRMETLGDRKAMEAQLEKKNRRIQNLEKTYAALTLALETLNEARAELQRRFAPRIAKRAQENLTVMTGGRYRSLSMGEDFSLQAGTESESTLRDILWRSDGTVDQLYLALRLAVAEELTPDAPLILDDALVRFDDARMKAAVTLLREAGEKKQVLCFTCQQREASV